MLSSVDVDELRHALGGVVLEAAYLERTLRTAFSALVGSKYAAVVDGRLTLRGQLDSEEQIREVAAAAGEVPGVAEGIVLLHLPGTPAPNKAAALEADKS